MFNIQDPRYENSMLLNDALLEGCKNAMYGAGTYAFVSAEGVNLFMNNQTFKKFIEEGYYYLIIGMDEITNTRTLAAIEQFCNKYPNLRVEAIMHNTKGSTFHPKFSWFKYKEGGKLVLGSGNLTQKGLRRNTEAFVLQQLNEEEIVAIEEKWIEWVESSEKYLKTLQNSEVILRAEQNTRQIIKNTKIECEDDAWNFDLNSEALIVEIPIKHDWNINKYCKVNFELDTTKVFFDKAPGLERQIALKKVRAQGFLEDIEIRDIVLTPSNKYQIELTGSEHIAHLENERVVGVFIKVSVRTFIYMIIMPEDRGYKELEEKLNNYRCDINQLVSHQTNVNALKDILSFSPCWFLCD
jgi:HKD family nuclease